MDPTRRNQIALLLYNSLGPGGERPFLAFDGNSEASQAYFDNVARIGRSMLHSFGNASAMPPGLAQDLSDEKRGEVAYAVLKFELWFNQFNLHERTPEVLIRIGESIGVGMKEFFYFVLRLYAEAVDDMSNPVMAGLAPRREKRGGE